MTAIPSEPPTWRMLFSTAEPTPALSTGTACMAVAVVGAIDIAIPAPPIRSAGKMSQKFECRSSWPKITSEPATRVIPEAISQRDPKRSLTFPAIGARKTMQSVIGRKVAPAWVGE